MCTSQFIEGHHDIINLQHLLAFVAGVGAQTGVDGTNAVRR